MSTAKEYWDKLHDFYTGEDWINNPTLFAQWVIQHFPPSGTILDLGGGQGQDTRFFADKGYHVTLTDISQKGLDLALQKTPDALKPNIKLQLCDISKSLPFSDESFDIVYSHLAVHYFDTETTQKIFSEMYRTLKSGGVVAIFTNSINDPEYGSGEELETDFYNIEGVTKRFFSKETMLEFTQQFETIVIDDRGETPKDRAVNTSNLIRYVGKKK